MVQLIPVKLDSLCIFFLDFLSLSWVPLQLADCRTSFCSCLRVRLCSRLCSSWTRCPRGIASAASRFGYDTGRSTAPGRTDSNVDYFCGDRTRYTFTDAATTPEREQLIMNELQNYLVVLPTFNESVNLERILSEILDQDERIDVLVVDDNSPDGTGDLADTIASENPRISVLHRKEKQGLGSAYLEGFSWGLQKKYSYFIEMDADFSHRPQDLNEFIDKSVRYEMVLGSRYLNGRVTVINWPMSRLLISYFGSWYARMVTGLPVRDATGGFNCWHREVISKLDFGSIESNGYIFQIELKLRAWRKGHTMIEIPIVFEEREAGESKMTKSIVIEAVWKVWKLRVLSMLGRL